MSVKKQIPSFCKLYPFNEGISADFLDETDVDSYFYLNIFDICQSQHRMLRLRKDSNKKSSCIQIVPILPFRELAGLYPPRRSEYLQGRIHSSVDSLRDFLKNFDKASKCLQIPSPKLEIEIGSRQLKNNLLAHYYNDIIEQPIRQIRLSFGFRSNTSSVFSIKKFELHSNKFNLTEIVNISHREIHHLYKN